MVRRISMVGVVAFVAAGCYHATIDTGLPPGNQGIEQGFASSFLWGLVPPATVETANQCPNGVARVETQISFVNGLVNILTFSIYTPMSISVTCAAGMDDGADLPEVDASASGATPQAFMEAADRAVETGGPVLVRLR